MSVEVVAAEDRQGSAPVGLRRFLPAALIFIGYLLYFSVGAEPERAVILPGYLAECLVWCSMLAMLIWRDPENGVRLSNPLLPILVVFANFFILPAASWAHGADLEHTWHQFGRLRTDTVNHIQYLHAFLMASFGVAYFTLGPRETPSHPDRRDSVIPPGRTLVLIGLIVPVATVVGRVATTGHIFPQANYGADWQSSFLAVENNRAVGGAGYLLDQVLSKLWLYPMMALGVGSGLVLSRLIQQRRRVLIAVSALIPAALITLMGGARSGIALTFFVSLCVADWLVGPLKWRWLAVLAVLGLLFFNLFGIYRGVQDRSFSEAIEMTAEGYQEQRGADNTSAEGASMLVKEHYGVTYVDATGTQLGAEFILQQLLWLLPSQLIPEKLTWFHVASWLSREMLNDIQVRAGGGTAGAMVVDGYFVAGDLGVVILGLLLGGIFGGAVRLLLVRERRIGGVPFWRVAIVMTLAHHSIVFVRADLGSLIVTVLYFIIIPVGALQLIRTLWRDDDPWLRPVKLSGARG